MFSIGFFLLCETTGHYLNRGHILNIQVTGYTVTGQLLVKLTCEFFIYVTANFKVKQWEIFFMCKAKAFVY